MMPAQVEFREFLTEMHEWELAGAKIVSVKGNEKHYAGKFEYYYKRGNSFYFRGGNQKITVKLTDAYLDHFDKVKMHSYFDITFSV